MSDHRWPFRPTTAGYYIEPGPDTPPHLRDAIERARAATILPIPVGPRGRW